MTVIWNDKLLTRDRAANMCGTWNIKLDYPYLRCSDCDMNILRLPENGMIITVDSVISAVVRHMVMTKHGYNLSGDTNAGNGSGTEAGAAVGSYSDRVSNHPVH